MMSACATSRPVDSPVVLARIREGLPVVHMICRQLKRQLGLSLSIEEMLSHGREGLLAAARSYDASRGVPFRRWANLRIRGAVFDGIRASSTLPRSVYARLRAMERAARVHDELVREGDTSLPETPAQADAALAEYLARAATAVALGLVGRLEPGGQGELFHDEPTAEEKMIKSELFRAIRRSVEGLPDTERTLLLRHYFDGLTFERAASELGLSKSWASRLHARGVAAVMRNLKRTRWV
jgi:RNA polymerase sigma factor for flagellar operon FliA